MARFIALAGLMLLLLAFVLFWQLEFAWAGWLALVGVLLLLPALQAAHRRLQAGPKPRYWGD